MLFLFELEESFIPERPPSSPVKLLLLLLLLLVAVVVVVVCLPLMLMLLSVCVVVVVALVAHPDCDEISGGRLLSIINIPCLSLSIIVAKIDLCLSSLSLSLSLY